MADVVFGESDLDHLLRLRLVVARFGEMDNARWWNTKGLLGRLGTIALSRGFPRSHAFAQARAVFMVASDRCRHVFDSPDAYTLWKLPATLQDQFESCWPRWTEGADHWCPFFDRLQEVGDDLLALLNDLDLLEEVEAREASKLRRAAGNRAVPLSGDQALSTRTFRMLAAGFFRGEPGEPAIPYVRVRCE